jgi:hypothetical protein
MPHVPIWARTLTIHSRQQRSKTHSTMTLLIIKVHRSCDAHQRLTAIASIDVYSLDSADGGSRSVRTAVLTGAAAPRLT